MAIGFLPNGVSLKPTVPENATDAQLEQWWRDRLDLRSVDAREVYKRYDRGRD